jgi:hypothetical protein
MDGRFDLSLALPNSDDNTVEFVYTRDHTGRVVIVECHLKLPKEQVQSTDSRNKDGHVVHCDCRIEKMQGEDQHEAITSQSSRYRRRQEGEEEVNPLLIGPNDVNSTLSAFTLHFMLFH